MKNSFLDFYNNFLDFYYFYLEGFVFVLKIISLLFSIFLIIFIINILFKIRKNIKKDLNIIAKSVVISNSFKKDLDKKWQVIINRLEKGSDSDYKIAIIEADNIFDDLLKKMGYQGNDMGERLKQITKNQLANIDDLWQAHKIRNRIAHEPSFKLTQLQAKRAIEIYQRATQDLESL